MTTSQYLVPGKYGRPSYLNDNATIQYLDATPGYVNGTSVSSSTETGTGTLAFGGISFTGTSVASTIGAGNLAFGPIAFAGAGTDKHSGTGILAFAGISIIAGASELGAPGDGKRFFWTF